MILYLYGKEGIAVMMSVHRDVLCGSSAFFAEKLSDGDNGHGGSLVPCVEIHDCDGAEIYVETVGLMYCDEAKQKLLKQHVSRVLRIMKILPRERLMEAVCRWRASQGGPPQAADDGCTVDEISGGKMHPGPATSPP